LERGGGYIMDCGAGSDSVNTAVVFCAVFLASPPLFLGCTTPLRVPGLAAHLRAVGHYLEH